MSWLLSRVGSLFRVPAVYLNSIFSAKKGPKKKSWKKLVNPRFVPYLLHPSWSASSSEANQCKRTAESQSRISGSNFLQCIERGIFHISTTLILNSNQNHFAAINTKQIRLLRTWFTFNTCTQPSTVRSSPEEKNHTQVSNWRCSDNVIIRDDNRIEPKILLGRNSFQECTHFSFSWPSSVCVEMSSSFVSPCNIFRWFKENKIRTICYTVVTYGWVKLKEIHSPNTWKWEAKIRWVQTLLTYLSCH